MSFITFKSAYTRRKEHFGKTFEASTLRRIYRRLKKGEEVPLSYFQGKLDPSKRLLDIFIPLPQVSRVIDKMQESVDIVEEDRDSVIQIIYGEYGHGKSQTAHLVYEGLLDRSTIDKTFIHMESITSFKSFLKDYAANIQSQIMEKSPTILPSAKELIDTLSASDKMGQKYSLGELIQKFADLVTVLSKQDYSCILVFDEVDKITHDRKDLSEWIDFFATVNGLEGVGLMIGIFIPQRSADILLKADERMYRWETLMNLEAVFLDGKYAEEVYSGVANIIALSTFNNNADFTDEEMHYIFDAINFKQTYLNNASIRQVNMWAMQISEFMNHCNSYGLWGKIENFTQMSPAHQAMELEKRIKLLLEYNDLANIRIKNEEDDEQETYRIDFNPENLGVNNQWSNGHYNVYRLAIGSELLEYQVAVDFKFTTQRVHDGVQLEKIRQMAEGLSTIFISIGMSQDNAQGLGKQIQETLGNKAYPLKVINTPMELLYPLLIIPEDKDTFQRIKGLFMIWTSVITDLQNLLEKFFRELPDMLYERKIKLRMYELAGIEAKMQDEPSTTAVAAVKEEQIESTKGVMEAQLFIAYLVSIVEAISRAKQLGVLEREMDKFWRDENLSEGRELINRVPGFVEVLKNNNLVVVGQRSDRILLKTSPDWDSQKAISVLMEEYKNNS